MLFDSASQELQGAEQNLCEQPKGVYEAQHQTGL
jgi:hypothetical protein